MIVDIYIRTYKNDLGWLQYCLKSIHKYVTGYRKIIVCIPEDQAYMLKDFNLQNIIACPIYKNDYIGQQVSKLLSYKETDAEYILFVDSDVCFCKPTNVEYFFKKGKPIIFKTKYESVGDAICWKAPTEALLGVSVTHEYMRRLPIIYKRSTLEAIGNKFDINSFANRDRLSEFNLVGAYSEIYEKKNYFFWDTEENHDLPEACLIQGWSWGGITEDKRKELEEILK